MVDAQLRCSWVRPGHPQTGNGTVSTGMKDFAQLRASVDAARKEYHQTLEAQREVHRRYTGMPHPDGSQHVHHVNENLRLALERYTQALRDLTDHVLKRM